MDTMPQTVPRETDLAKLRPWRDKAVVKVITGARRCGKSTLLAMWADQLRAEGVPADRVLSFNLEDMSLVESLPNPADLHARLLAALPPEGRSYLFIDEVQLADSFEQVLNSVLLHREVDVYVTGSNAQMLSSELATRLSGRYVEIHLLPLSFAQFADGRREFAQSDEDLSYPGLYASYLRHGGFPFIQQLIDTPDAARDYLSGIANTVLVKDVAVRQKVANVALLSDVAAYLMQNTGNLTSLRRVANAADSRGRLPSATTVDSYIQGLVDAFLVYPVRRWDLRGLRFLAGPEKYYAVDTGLRNAMVGYAGGDSGHLLETVVFLELKRRYGDVRVGMSPDGEVDFVVAQGADRTYYQVALTVRDPETLMRELTPLLQIRDHHPKVLLTLDAEPPITHDGVRQLYVLDWLRQSP